MPELNTLKNIQKAAKKEFLEKGFKSASLRNIVKEAGVTTGAFYGYYRSKEALFDAIVGEQASVFMTSFWLPRIPLRSFRRRSSRTIWAKFPETAWIGW